MARKIDPAVEKIVVELGLNPKDALWDCHGTWCMYHRTLEHVAAKQGIKFAPPAIIENDGANKCVAICVTGTLGERSEWSIGEAAPWNNKNAYPWAMAEKRAKDRVTLKLIGLHGLVYSDAEVDRNAPPEPEALPADNIALDSVAIASDIIREIKATKNPQALQAVTETLPERVANLAEADKERIRSTIRTHRKSMPDENLLKAG
jgi:hypothetical protein